MLTWFFRKGIAGTISKDLIGKYLLVKSQYPNEDDHEILTHVWKQWLTVNEDHILSENNRDKIIRLQIIKEKKSSNLRSDALLNQWQTLLGLYQDILYIETEILLTEDQRAWRHAISVFLENAKQNGLDFSNEYESYTRLIPRLKI